MRSKPRQGQTTIRRALEERDQALRFQAATAEILASLSRSRESPQPVFDAIVENVRRLFGTRYAVAFLLKGEQLDLVAVNGDARFEGRSREAGERFRASFPQPVDSDSFTGKALRAKKVMQLSPIIGNPAASPRAVALAKTFGYNSIVIAPLVHGSRVIGAIGTNHPEAKRYGEKELQILKSFADQAVIAIENARLFNETKDALERQKATADVLRVIAASPGIITPVLRSVAESAARLCEANDVLIRLVERGTMRAVEHIGAIPLPENVVAPPITRNSLAGRAILECRTIHVPDVTDPAVRQEYPDAVFLSQRMGLYRTVLDVPMVRDGKAVGVIVIRREEARPFSDQHVRLLETFADQAVIAIDNARLFNETKQALERQTATAEVLEIISRSPGDVQPVLDAVAERAARACGAADAIVMRVEGSAMRRAAHFGPIPSASEGRPITRDTPTGRAIAERKIIHVGDILEEFARGDYAEAQPLHRATGFRTVLSVPLVQEGAVIGAVTLRRLEVRPFSEKEIDLLGTFAGQAVIAIENVRLFNETKQALERQTATAEVLRVIAGSPSDAQPVFDAIVDSAMRLLKGATAHMTRLDAGELHLAAYSKTDAAGAAALQGLYPLAVAGTVVENVLESRTPLVVTDAEADPRLSDAVRTAMRARGVRSFILAPLVSRGSSIGTIVVNRRTAESFSAHETRVLQTFADQAVIAIENARLFNETKEALERQTATAEVLRVISGSLTDTQPVFDIIAERAARLTDAAFGWVFMYDGECIRAASWFGLNREAIDTVLKSFPMRPGGGSYTARAIRDRHVVNVADALAENDPDYVTKPVAAAAGYRSVLCVPMCREEQVVGAITVSRAEVGRFGDKEVDLLRTFADQAVIAIENARLFNETKEALERQTATADILTVISSSPTDVQPVFDTIIRNAVQLCDGAVGVLFRYDGINMDIGSLYNLAAETEVLFRRAYPQPASPENPGAQAIVERDVVSIDDVEAADYSAAAKERARAVGYRGVLVVPLMRDGKPIGSIAVGRRMPGKFPDAYVALLKTFADQAVIAIENVRLFNETKEALERQTATAEILKVISSSTTDTQPVFEAIVRSAARLFPMSNATLFMRDGELIRLLAFDGETVVDDGMRQELARIYPIPFNPEVSSSARAMVERQTNICLDTEAPGVPEHIRRAGRAGRFRSNTVVPLVRDDEGIGTIVITHPEPGHRLNEKQLALLRTFADQAVIAIENTRLFNETKEALEQQKASGEILSTISSSIADTQPVFDKILRSCERLFAGRQVGINLVDAGGRIRIGAYHGPGREELERVAPFPPGDASGSGAAIAHRRVMHYPDASTDDVPPTTRRGCAAIGVKAAIFAPMLWEGAGIGVIFVGRDYVGPFSEKEIALLRTFADQAAIAIQNTRLFREIQDKSAQLEVANKHKSEFLANMSHELRTPLNAVIGFSEVLLERMFGEVNEKQADYLKDIHESGRHLLSLINDILDLSKIEAGRMELELSHFSLPGAIGNAITLVRERAQRHGIELGTEIDPRLGEVQADERKVKQILLNLLSNAVKFTPEGGRVDVSAKLDTDKVEIAVKDTGVGISADDQAKLFEEFRQVGGDAARKAEGTGLGLALAKKFVELHGGAIRVESAPGQGATFCFSLPLAPGGSPASSA